MSANDRLSSGYNPDFDHDLEVGVQGELFVASVKDAFVNGTVHEETKTDAKTAKTGNVYIEYAQKPRGYTQFKNSGIATTKAELWSIVLPSNVLLVAPAESVKAVALWHKENHRGADRECVRGDNPTKGVVIEVGTFLRHLIRLEEGAE